MIKLIQDQPGPLKATQRGSQQQPLEAGAVLIGGDINRRAGQNTWQEVQRRPQQATYRAILSVASVHAMVTHHSRFM